MPYTSLEFQNAKDALLKCNAADRAYLRRWILRWVDDRGHLSREADLVEPLPAKGC